MNYHNVPHTSIVTSVINSPAASTHTCIHMNYDVCIRVMAYIVADIILLRACCSLFCLDLAASLLCLSLSSRQAFISSCFLCL